MIREQMVLEVKMPFYDEDERNVCNEEFRYSGSHKQLYFPCSGYRPGRERVSRATPLPTPHTTPPRVEYSSQRNDTRRDGFLFWFASKAS